MKIGKISEAVLKRSVLKYEKTRREEVVVGPGIGEDCSALDVGEDLVVLSTEAFVQTLGNIAVDTLRLAVHKAVNNLTTDNALPVGILLTVLVPLDTEEQSLRQLIMDAEDACKQLHIQVIGGHTQVSSGVNCPVVTITGVGRAKKEALLPTKGISVGDEFVVTKWIALEGTAYAAKAKEEELCNRYPKDLVETAKSFDEYISILPEAQIAGCMGASAMHDITNGGIFAALWEMANASGVGLDVDLKKIPVRQETIEVCNQLDLNPYELASGGSLLIATKAGTGLVEALLQAQIPAVVIGSATTGNDRIIRNGEEIRFLEPPKSDQIFKL